MQEPFFWTQVEEKVRTWALYHRAIALRRLARFDEAERQLQPALENRSSEHWVAANHELGVICLERFSRSKNKEHLIISLHHFRESRALWHSQRNHREGFALHRMAQVYALQGRFDETARCLFEAVDIFSRCRCARYVKEIYVDLEKYILPKLRVAPDNVLAPPFEGPVRKSAGASFG
jgi:tetratricopeptide (TPR) repeat protein